MSNIFLNFFFNSSYRYCMPRCTFNFLFHTILNCRAQRSAIWLSGTGRFSLWAKKITFHSHFPNGLAAMQVICQLNPSKRKKRTCSGRDTYLKDKVEFNFLDPVIGFKIMRTTESNSFCNLVPLVQNVVCPANRKCKVLISTTYLDIKSWNTSQSVGNVGEDCWVHRRIDIVKIWIAAVVNSEKKKNDCK